MKDLKVIVRFKNNLILSRIHEKWASVAAFCREKGLQQYTVGLLINFKISPIRYKYKCIHSMYGDDGILWRKPAYELATALECLPEHIFPDQLREERKNRYEIEINTNEIGYNEPLMLEMSDPEKDFLREEVKKQVKSILNDLTERQKKVIILRFGLDGKGDRTLQETAKELGEVTRERIRQVEAIALRNIRSLYKKGKVDNIKSCKVLYDTAKLKERSKS